MSDTITNKNTTERLTLEALALLLRHHTVVAYREWPSFQHGELMRLRGEIADLLAPVFDGTSPGAGR